MRFAPVSVVIPGYNCVATLSRAVSSVFAQTWFPEEIILVDDCSVDATFDEMLRLQALEPERVRLLRLSKNGGVAAARNAGWDMAGGDYIAFLDADDSWHPKKLELQIGAMRRKPALAMSGHAMRQMRAVSCDHDVVPRALRPSSVSVAQMLIWNPFQTPSVVVKRSIPIRFDPAMRVGEDYRLWLEIVASGYSAEKYGTVLAYTYKAAYGHTGLSKDIWEMRRQCTGMFRHLAGLGRISQAQAHLAAAFYTAKTIRKYVVSATRCLRK